MYSKYDHIGQGYDATRRADPYLLERIHALLNPEVGKKYFDIGCGTGNYTIALSKKGFHFTGFDPSEKMLAEARRRKPEIDWICATAETLPSTNGFFDGAIGTLTIHHWAELEKAFGEIGRVLKPGARMILFTSTPEQMQGYWLNHYFPKMLAASIAQMPSLTIIEKAATKAGMRITGIEKYFVKDDLQDGFLYVGKNKPLLYFDPLIQNGISSFTSLSHADEVTNGLQKLKADIANGTFETIQSKCDNKNGDYLFIVLSKAI